jgi:hypothetical protein
MRQVNCHIPIKVCIRGRPSDAQLDELGEALIRAIAARMEQARRTLSERGHGNARETFASNRQLFDPGRLSNGGYGLPAYDKAGETVTVPVTGDIEAELEKELQKLKVDWDYYSKDVDATFDERAYARRFFILLYFGPDSPLKTKSDLKNFIDRSEMLAHGEEDTLDETARSVKRDDLLLDEGAAFPIKWALKVRSEFETSADLDELRRTMESAKSEVLKRANNLSDDVWDRGLPLTKNEAADLNLSNLVGRVLSVEHARSLSDDVIGRYSRALWDSQRAQAHYVVVGWYKSQIDLRRENIKKGELVINKDEYNALKGMKKVFQFKLKAFIDAASTGDMNKAILALKLQFPDRFYRVSTGERYDWPKDDVQSLWAAIAKVDARIAGTGRVKSVWRALVWANERNYFSAAGKEVWEAIKDNWLEMIGTMLAIIVAQAIPGLDIAVDLVLLIEFGVDAVDGAVNLAGALKDAASAKSVVEMEHASARLASVLVGKAAEIALWAATWGTVKVARELVKWRKVERFVKTHGDNTETRDALLKSKGNAEEAEKILAKKREYERQQRELELAEQRRKAAEAERKRKLEEEAAAKRKQEQEAAAAAKQKQQEEAEAEARRAAAKQKKGGLAAKKKDKPRQVTAAPKTGPRPPESFDDIFELTGVSERKSPGTTRVDPHAETGLFAHKHFKSLEDLFEEFNKDAAKYVDEYPKGGHIEPEFQIEHPDYPPNRKPRVDLLDWDNAKIFEIKPRSKYWIQKGKVQAKQYAEWMNKYHKRADGRLWEVGGVLTYDKDALMAWLTDKGYLSSSP